ncbi:hypothetical protein [Corynebacterium sp.]|uniref:hypothetical protein n=1 Tax=Corynebacterium sp. TaxID=1720 RepID=UPI003B3B1770
MAAPQHLLYTPEQVATSTLAALKYKSTLARLVNQDFSREIVAGRGASVTVKRPILIEKARIYTAADRAAENEITYSNLLEPYTSVSISDQVYNAVKLPDDFQTFTLTDIERQVVAPMAESVSEGINEIVAKTFEGIAAGLTAADRAAKGALVGKDGKTYANINALRDAGTQFAGYGAKVSVAAGDLTATTNADVLKVIRAAHRLFAERGVPMDNRVLVVGSGWEAALLSQDILNKVNEAGSADQLRRATLGSLYGFTIVADYTIDPYAAYALQRDAVTLVTRTTVAPRGASFASTVSADGFTLRYLQDYDPNILTDRAVVDTFAGAQVLDAQRIVRLTGTAGFEEKAAASAGGEAGGE